MIRNLKLMFRTLKIILPILFLTFNLCQLYGQDSNFDSYLNQIVEPYYIGEAPEVIDSAKQKLWSTAKGQDDSLMFQAIVEVCGKRFFRSSLSQIDNQLLTDAYSVLNLNNSNYPKTLDSLISTPTTIMRVENSYYDPINLIWDIGEVGLYPTISEGEFADSLLLHLLASNIQNSNLVEKSSLSLISLEPSDINELIVSNLQGYQKQQAYYYWLLSLLAKDKKEVVNQYLKKFKTCLDEDLSAHNFDMAVWYVAYAKFINSVDFYGNFDSTIKILALADSYIEGTADFDLKLSILSLKAQTISMIPGLYSKRKAFLLVSEYYKKHRSLLPYDWKIKLLTLITHHWNVLSETERIESYKSPFRVNYFSYCYLSCKYFATDRGAYGNMARLTLASLLKSNRRYHEMMSISWDMMYADNTPNPSKSHYYEVLMNLVSGYLYLDNYQFFDQQFSSKTYNSIIILLVKRHSQLIADELYNAKYAINGEFIENTMAYNEFQEMLDWVEHSMTTVHGISGWLQFQKQVTEQLISSGRQWIDKDPRSEYYVKLALQRIHRNLAKSKAKKHKWKKAYVLLNKSNNIRPKDYSYLTYNLGSAMSWSTSEVRIRDLKIKEQYLFERNTTLDIQNKNLEIFNESLENANSNLIHRNKDLKTNLTSKSIQIKVLNLRFANLQDTYLQLKNTNEKLEQDIKKGQAEVEELNVKKLELEEDIRMLLWRQTVGSTVLVLIIVLLLFSIAQWRKQLAMKKRAIASEQIQKFQKMVMYQLGHTAPGCISELLKNDIIPPKVEKQLKQLHNILFRFHIIHQNPYTLIGNEYELIKAFIDFRYAGNARKIHSPSSLIVHNLTEFFEVQAPLFVLLNIVSNAFDHGNLLHLNGKGNVEITMSKKGDWYFVSVRNPSDIPTSNDESTGLQFVSGALCAWNQQNGKFLNTDYSYGAFTTKITLKERQIN